MISYKGPREGGRNPKKEKINHLAWRLSIPDLLQDRRRGDAEDVPTL